MERHSRFTCAYGLTFGYVASSMLLYALLVWLCVACVWPDYLAGGEPLSESFYLDPDLVMMESQQAAFQARYLWFAIGTGLFALMGYLGFVLFWKSHYQFYAPNRRRSRWKLMLWGVTITFAGWESLFRLPDRWMQPLSVALPIIVGVSFLLLWLSSVRNRQPKADDVEKRRFPWFDTVLDGLGLLVNLIMIGLGISEIDVIQRVPALVADMIARLGTACPDRYLLVAPIQYAASLVPVIPLAMLWLFLISCMPRSMGTDLCRGGRLFDFYCMDKVKGGEQA